MEKTPKEIVDKIIEAVSIAKESGKIRKGVNEVTKAIEKKTASLVVIAEDVEPQEIVLHLPKLCEEKEIPHVCIPSKKLLGEAAGLTVPTSAVAVENPGNATEILQAIIKRVSKKEEKKKEE